MDKIIINGKVGSGKNTVADYLVKEYGYTKLTFADGVKEVSNMIFKTNPKEDVILQQISQKMREIDPNVWINYTISKAKKHDKVVISDCIRANEYEVMADLGYFPIRINSDINIRLERITKRDGKVPNIRVLESEIETEIDKYPYLEIYNDTSLDELYKQIDNLIENRGRLDE